MPISCGFMVVDFEFMYHDNRSKYRVKIFRVLAASEVGIDNTGSKEHLMSNPFSLP
jgi:hypothetical protein